jgi:hypothetical protein
MLGLLTKRSHEKNKNTKTKISGISKSSTRSSLIAMEGDRLKVFWVGKRHIFQTGRICYSEFLLVLYLGKEDGFLVKFPYFFDWI